MAKVTIDRDECISCGVCWSNCGEFFEENPDDGLSQVLAQYQIGGNPAEGKVPEELIACVNDAADGCPVSVIHVD